MLIPAVTIIPGLVAVATIKGLGGGGENLDYNNAIPLLMNEYLPNGMLGIALAGLLAAFMAGVAANVSAFNTVVTYDLWQDYVKPGPERRVLRPLRPPGDGRRHRRGDPAPR